MLYIYFPNRLGNNILLLNILNLRKNLSLTPLMFRYHFHRYINFTIKIK